MKRDALKIFKTKEERNMKKIIPLLILAAMLLTACATPALAPTAAPAATQPAQVTSVLPTASDQPATEAVTSAPSTSGTPSATQASAPPAGASSGSVVVYQIDPSQSKVSYQVDEVFLNQGNRLNTAVGVTQGISGTVQIDRSSPKNSQLSPFTVDISQFKSDSERRDQTIRERFLESATYPTVTFVPKTIEGLPDTIQDGTDYPLKISGDLTIHQAAKPVTFDVTARLQGDTLSGQATTQILMSDFGFGPINLFGILKTNDEVKVTFEFVARPKGG